MEDACHKFTYLQEPSLEEEHLVCIGGGASQKTFNCPCLPKPEKEKKGGVSSGAREVLDHNCNLNPVSWAVSTHSEVEEDLLILQKITGCDFSPPALPPQHIKARPFHSLFSNILSCSKLDKTKATCQGSQTPPQRKSEPTWRRILLAPSSWPEAAWSANLSSHHRQGSCSRWEMTAEWKGWASTEHWIQSLLQSFWWSKSQYWSIQYKYCASSTSRGIPLTALGKYLQYLQHDFQISSK